MHGCRFNENIDRLPRPYQNTPEGDSDVVDGGAAARETAIDDVQIVDVVRPPASYTQFEPIQPCA